MFLWLASFYRAGVRLPRVLPLRIKHGKNAWFISSFTQDWPQGFVLCIFFPLWFLCDLGF
ncbi:hypothetical protein [Aquicella siphonis]|uniref:hypothetical protein n=1 Tax=Aquicella siphonis TaxID=254247 RepID=UPI0011DD9628|nr:hypothetical protein [Aquicella siphonis]